MNKSLDRTVGVGGAMMLGLGSMVGTGVFVSIGIAAGVTGPSVILSIAIAALVATTNALSSAQLAAAHPVSGGTYEYGYRYLRPVLGFAAGWMFLVAKSASAATAALGLAGYISTATGLNSGIIQTVVPLAIVAFITAVAAAGLRRSTALNTVIVLVTVGSLATLIVATLPEADPAVFSPFFVPESGRGNLSALLYAAALSFVAFTGYGRIATLGEEIKDPARNIPRAIAATVAVVFVLYTLVAWSAITVLGPQEYASAAIATRAPLEIAAGNLLGGPGQLILTVGAAVALLGVLLNLILGLSRVLLAMGRRRDMPAATARIVGGTPRAAVLIMGVVVAMLTLVGNIRITWSFSAVTVLTYYALTNLSALRLPEEARRFPKWISVVGLTGCLSLAAFVEPRIVGVAGIVLAAGLIWHFGARRLASRTQRSDGPGIGTGSP
jgi:APA family basic amino acid/polyamine antiporter